MTSKSGIRYFSPGWSFFMAVNSLGGTSAQVNGSSSAQERWLGTDWRAEAACSEATGTKLFFPVGVTGPAEIQIRQAKAVCEECPVKMECLDFAITTNQEYGVWGGTSEEERRVLRRKWRQNQRALRAQQAKKAS
jgi:WhiB family redox-sensing transcriptional regulator